MIKGSQKQLIVLRTSNSRYFDEAYFVLRRDLSRKECRRGDMVSEANRILAEQQPPKTSRPRRLLSLALFLTGVALGAGTTLLLCLLL